jgi:ABC-type uncharacterized transport system permease subunit
MNILIAASTAITLYIACSVLLILSFKQFPALKTTNIKNLLIPGFLALIAHGFVLYMSMASAMGVNFGFYNALSLVSACIVLITLISALRHPVEILCVLITPLASLFILLDISNTTTHVIAPGSSNALIFHILSSLIAYSILGLSAMHAILLSIQNSFLHSHQPGGIVRLMPPLKTMESLLFETIFIGFICLTISLATGLIFLENMFAQDLAHKTVLSIIAWLVFATLLYGHKFLGWRGKTAIRWTLGGFVSLMLAYFGSKYVYEVLLS